MKTVSHKVITPIILFMVIIAPLAIDEYTPSLPHMAKSFQTSVGMLQITVTAYLITFALSQFFLGAVSDRFGRKKTLLWASPCYMIGSIVCYFSTSIESIIIGRLIQGIGGGAFAMTSSTLIADCFEKEKLQRITSMYSAAYALVPIAAPVLGGFIQEYISWQANFTAMFLISMTMYIYVCWRMPETHEANPSHKLVIKTLIKNYRTVLSNQRYLLAVFGCCVIWGMEVSFTLIAPFIIEGRMGYSPSVYGFAALFAGLGIMFGSITNTIMLKYYTYQRNTHIGMAMIAVISVAFFILSYVAVINIWILVCSSFLITWGAGIVFPNLNSISISENQGQKGVSNALIGALMTIWVALVSAFIAQIHAQSPEILASICIGSSILIYFLVMTVFKKDRQYEP